MVSKERRDNFRNVIINTLQKVYNKDELWMMHPYTDGYHISNTGKIKSLYNNKEMKQFVNSDGYKMVNINWRDKSRGCVMVHRLVMESFMNYLTHDNMYYEVNHIDGNKTNNNLSNLEWTTRQENLQHARDNKLFKSMKGEFNSNCKLTNKDIDDIIAFTKLGFTQIEIAKSYNVNKDTIRKAIKRREHEWIDLQKNV